MPDAFRFGLETMGYDKKNNESGFLKIVLK